MVALNDAGKTATLGVSNNVHFVADFEQIHSQHVTGLRSVGIIANFLQYDGRFGAAFLKVPAHRL